MRLRCSASRRSTLPYICTGCAEISPKKSSRRCRGRALDGAEGFTRTCSMGQPEEASGRARRDRFRAQAQANLGPKINCENMYFCERQRNPEQGECDEGRRFGNVVREQSETCSRCHRRRVRRPAPRRSRRSCRRQAPCLKLRARRRFPIARIATWTSAVLTARTPARRRYPPHRYRKRQRQGRQQYQTKGHNYLEREKQARRWRKSAARCANRKENGVGCDGASRVPRLSEQRSMRLSPSTL